MTADDVTAIPQLEPGQLSPFEDSSRLLSDPEALRARAQRDGFLFLPGLLDPASILRLRAASLRVFDRHGLRAEPDDKYSARLDLSRLNAIPAEEMRDDIGVTHQIYFELQQLPELHRLPHHPSLLELYRQLFGSDVFVHPRHIMRAMTTHPAMTPTPPHQDFPLVQGTTETWTCWFPIGDCDVDHGSLAVLRGSHHNGCLPVVAEAGAGGIAAQLCGGDNDWVGGDFQIGDVLTFSSLTVHRGIRPTVTDEVRLSLDVRYQRVADPIEERSLGNHSARPWDEIYDGWPESERDLMYYWAEEEMPRVDWNESLIQPGMRRIC